jgi:hypothetical protein
MFCSKGFQKLPSSEELETCARKERKIATKVRGHTHYLQLILPKLLFSGLVEKGKVANMVDKDVSKNG